MRDRAPLALFDFDGTITTHETMPDFLRRSTPRARRIVGGALLAPAIAGYRLGRVSGVRIRAWLVHVCYRGRSAAHLAAAGEDFAAKYLRHVLRDEAMQRIAWHRAQGHRVVVVSGGLDVYLAPWCAAHRLELACSSLEVRDGRLTGRYAGAQCVGDEKMRRVRALCDPDACAEVHAYADTPEDHAMLAMATHRWYRGRPMDAGDPA